MIGLAAGAFFAPIIAATTRVRQAPRPGRLAGFCRHGRSLLAARRDIISAAIERNKRRGGWHMPIDPGQKCAPGRHRMHAPDSFDRTSSGPPLQGH
jgi:plasmid stability protein